MYFKPVLKLYNIVVSVFPLGSLDAQCADYKEVTVKWPFHNLPRQLAEHIKTDGKGRDLGGLEQEILCGNGGRIGE